MNTAATVHTVIQDVNSEVEKVVSALTPAGKMAWHVLVENYQVQALQHLVFAVVSAAYLGLCVYLIYFLFFRRTKTPERLLRKGLEQTSSVWDRKEAEGEDIIILLLGVPVTIMAVAAFGVFVTYGLDVWNYIAFFHPNLYAAHELIGRVSG